MVDRTAEDLAQDQRLGALEGRADGQGGRIKNIEARAALLDAELATLKTKLARLEPLADLAAFADHIRHALGLPKQ